MADGSNNPEASSETSYEFVLGDELRGERATMGKSLLDVQRDLRIKAAYIAAIENAEPEVFPNPAFIPGYVRSYARYLNLDPDEIYARFCRQSGFSASSAASRPEAVRMTSGARPSGGFRSDFPMASVSSALPNLPVAALFSLLVLVALLGGLGYGAWTVLENIQRVEFAPVEEVPVATVAIEALETPEGSALEEPALSDLASPVAAIALADLYRQQDLEVPILVPRDGPIAAIDPDGGGLLASRGAERLTIPGKTLLADASAALIETGPALQQLLSKEPAPDPQVTATAERVPVTVLAERAAWIRVYLENGTVIFERILERGEAYSPPADLEAPLIWAGNSGSVYVRVGDTLRGPLGPGTRAVRDVVLEPQALTDRFALVEKVPEGIAGPSDTTLQRVEAAVTVQ